MLQREELAKQDSINTSGRLLETIFLEMAWQGLDFSVASQDLDYYINGAT